ncbi:MAG: ComEA family DNA-binding protein [Acholeplasmataceae bacterium]|nr:ComEA family DNA-binding protein [Acholeplasmataceae bacterium]
MKKGLTIYGIIAILFILYGIYLYQPNSIIPTDPVLIKVEIKGGILLPGTYQVSPKDTLEDLIGYAGGFSENAIKDEIKLDEVLMDQTIYIIQEYVRFEKININTATKDELQMINGIGPVTAEAIVIYRIKHGPFIYLEDLMKVNNIGEKTYEKIKDYITL